SIGGPPLWGGGAPAFLALFDAARPTVLVTASDACFWGSSATLEASRRGIPSVALQHGMMVGSSAYVPVVSSRFAAWGDASARWLEARGVAPEKLVVTGAPRLDQIVNRSFPPRGTVAAKLEIDPALRWIVLATNPIAFARNAALLATAREGMRTWGERAVLVAKLHPSEDPGPYRAAAAGDPGIVIVPHGAIALYDLLSHADAVLTYHSSVGVEAMLLDRPVVSLESFGEENPLPYAREGAAAAARTAGELAGVLRREVAPGRDADARRERRARFVRDNLLAADGKSAERVAELIRGLASGGAS
ncbi:MAG: CDP-glycerol glycerophosphotransferase family protein, partial [Myxococcota bacterium]